MSAGPKYAGIVVQLIGQDGNAFNVLGLVNRALRRAGVSDTEVSTFTAEATAGDYDTLLAVVQKWVVIQ